MGEAKRDQGDNMGSDGSDGSDGWAGIDHVQLAIPVGGEPAARRFFVDLLGFVEVRKPPILAARGGAWFEAGRGTDGGAPGVVVHVGVENPFLPARKAHPALRYHGLRALIERTRLDARWSDEIPGTVRCHVDDPFGNRIELIEAAP